MGFLKRFVGGRGVVSQDAAYDILRSVLDPASQQDIVGLGWVSAVQIAEDGGAVVVLDVPESRAGELMDLPGAVEHALVHMGGVSKASAVMTAEAPVQATTVAEVRQGPRDDGELAPHVKKIIAVASGKGGVGKSTVAAGLAVALGRSGLNVGLLDADIYGPSQPMMMGLRGAKPSGEQGRIEPLEAHGVKVMSVGFLMPESDALVWRGPMVQKALLQMIRDVNWGSAEEPLDVLIVDLPPGTGDVQLSLAQKVPLAGAVIVSTPQDIALLDVRRGVEMFKKVNVPILGVIENMSTHVCSNCGHAEHIFGHGGARAEAEKMGVPFLGEIPLSADIRARADAGDVVEGGVFEGIAGLMRL